MKVFLKLIMLIILGVPTVGDDLYEVRLLLRGHYYKDIDNNIMMLPTVDSIFKVLKVDDPYVMYNSGDLGEYMRNYTSPKAYNLGLEFDNGDDSLPVIYKVAYGSPGYFAGLMEYDTVYAINDTNLRPSNWFGALRRTYNASGNFVKYHIHRGGRELVINVPREYFADPEIVQYFDANGTLFFRIESFNAFGIFREMDKNTDIFVRYYMEFYGKAVRRVVFDLRSCPGGSVQAAINILRSIAYRDDTLMITRGMDRGYSIIRATERGKFAGIRLEVLVGPNTASAAEIIANAVVDNEYGGVIGDTTYGKGTILRYDLLESGANIIYTNAIIYSPRGRCVDRYFGSGGLVPNSELKIDPIDHEQFYGILSSIGDVLEYRRKYPTVDTGLINRIKSGLPTRFQRGGEYYIARFIWSNHGKVWYLSTLGRYTRWARVRD